MSCGPCLFSTKTLLFPRPQVKLPLSCSNTGYACQTTREVPSGWSLVLQMNNSYNLLSHSPSLMWIPQTIPSFPFSLKLSQGPSPHFFADNPMFNHRTNLREDQENCLQIISVLLAPPTDPIRQAHPRCNLPYSLPVDLTNYTLMKSQKAAAWTITIPIPDA